MFLSLVSYFDNYLFFWAIYSFLLSLYIIMDENDNDRNRSDKVEYQ